MTDEGVCIMFPWSGLIPVKIPPTDLNSKKRLHSWEDNLNWWDSFGGGHTLEDMPIFRRYDFLLLQVSFVHGAAQQNKTLFHQTHFEQFSNLSCFFRWCSRFSCAWLSLTFVRRPPDMTGQSRPEASEGLPRTGGTRLGNSKPRKKSIVTKFNGTPT